jgi:hypothetical protein
MVNNGYDANGNMTSLEVSRQKTMTSPVVGPRALLTLDEDNDVRSFSASHLENTAQSR